MLKNKHNITIYGFMVEKLSLSACDLICFAIIFGFSKSNKTFRTSGLSYLCNWCNTDLFNIMKSLEWLEMQGLININSTEITINKSELIKLGVLKNDDKIVIA